MFLGLHVKYVLFYEKYKCYLIVLLLVVPGFEVKVELIRIGEVGLLQQHWNKVGSKRLCSYIIKVIFREGLLLFVLFVIGNLLVSGEVHFVRKVD